jgi:hypothetical protein
MPFTPSPSSAAGSLRHPQARAATPEPRALAQQRKLVQSTTIERVEMQTDINQGWASSRPYLTVFPGLKKIVVNKGFRGFGDRERMAKRRRIGAEAWVRRGEKDGVEVEIVLGDTREELGDQCGRWSRHYIWLGGG